MTLEVVFVNLVKGLVTGVLAAAVGFVKNLPDGECFDWRKAAPAVIIGGITGLVAGYMGTDLTSAGSLVASFGVVAFVNSLWSALTKQVVKTKFVKKLLK